jgi:CRP-like cAMP-binding protein
MLQDTPHNVLVDVARLAITHTFKRGEVVVQQGAGGESFFIVKKGHFRVLKEVLLPAEDTSKDNMYTRTPRRRRDALETKSSTRDTSAQVFMTEKRDQSGETKQLQTGRRGRRISSLADVLEEKKPMVSEFLEVNLLGMCSIFGEIPIIRTCKRTASVICVNGGEVEEITPFIWQHKLDARTKSLIAQQAVSYPTVSMLRQAYHEDSQWATYKNQIGDLLCDQGNKTSKVKGQISLPVFDSGVLGEYQLRVKDQ